MTKYYDFRKCIDKKEIEEIIDILNNDGVIIFPTETVYGIGCNALSNIAIKKIYEIKNRPLNKHLNIFVSDINEIEKYATVHSNIERSIINKYMPGAITIILEKKEFSENMAFDSDTIGIRIPDNEIMLEILKKIDYPLATTSANISGMESNVDVYSLKKYFDGKVDATIDGGTSKIGMASTIVKVEDEKIEILRHGNINIEI